MRLIGWGMGVAVGIGVNVGVGVKLNVFVAVDVCGTDVFPGVATACVAHAVTRKAIIKTTNKVFFITELLPIKKTTGGGLLPPPVYQFTCLPDYAFTAAAASASAARSFSVARKYFR